MRPSFFAAFFCNLLVYIEISEKSSVIDYCLSAKIFTRESILLTSSSSFVKLADTAVICNLFSAKSRALSA